MKKIRKIQGRLLAGVLIIALLYLAYNAYSIYQYGEKDETRDADTAIVLGAGVWGTEPSPVFRERINHGVWLYQNSYVKTLIFTGGFSEGNELSDAAVAKAYAVNRGVPEECIFIEEKSTITETNLYYARQIMEPEDLKTALLVSDPLHMKRSMLMAEDLGIKAYTSPTLTTKYVGIKAKSKFLAREVFFYAGYKLKRYIQMY